jgi:hypothetical protein
MLGLTDVSLDLPESQCGIAKCIRVSASSGILELGVIEGIVKLGPELESAPFSDLYIFKDRDVQVKLVGTKKDTHTSITPAGKDR